MSRKFLNGQTSTPAIAVASGGTGRTDGGNLLQSGEIAFFAMSGAPVGWLKANGAAISRTTYAALYAAIGTTWGSGDGSTTFNVPDLRGEFLRGFDDGRGLDSGRAFGSVQAQNLIPHKHRTPVGAINSTFYHSLDAGGNPIYGYTAVGSTVNYNIGNLNSGNGNVVQSLTEDVIYSPSGELRPRNVAILACIKY